MKGLEWVGKGNGEGGRLVVGKDGGKWEKGVGIGKEGCKE